MGQKLGPAGPLFLGREGEGGSPSNSMWSGPTSIPSSILIHPTVWSQYANVTQQDRQTGQRSDSIGRTVLQTVAPKRFALIGLLSVLSCPGCPVCDVGVLWPSGWMDQDATWYGERFPPRPHCVRLGPSSPTERGIAAPPLFGPLFWHVSQLSNSLTAGYAIMHCSA